MTRQGLVKIENGGNLTLGTLILLTQALGCQVADFFPRTAPWESVKRFRESIARREV